MNKLLRLFFKEKSLYDQIGSEDGIKILVKNFYDVMQTDPKARECLELHELSEGLVPDEIQDKLFMFFSGWLGGPNLFVEKYGHPRMRMRHMHAKIGEQEAHQWLYCMNRAIEKHPKRLSKAFRIKFLNSCKGLALRIINS